VLKRAKERAEYLKYQETERKNKEAEEEIEKAEFARIDWGDFVIVETITFSDEDDNTNLPPPTTLGELQYASLEDRNKASISANLRIEEAMPGEEDLIQNGATEARPSSFPLPVHTGYAPQQQAQTPQHVPSPVPVYGAAAPQQSAQEEEELRRIQERSAAQARMQQAQSEARGGLGPMKIRENYVPRAAQKAASKQGTQMALCPNCKQQIPLNELEAHMRSKF
jgi:splicing factor 3A subunit 1